MAKVTVQEKRLVYPMPAFLIGANVDGKPNFMTVAWGGIAGSTPPVVSVALNHIRHTLRGVRQNMTFSVNVPSVDQVRETDYCGIVSGAKADKVEVCKFKVFYGKLETAPLIEQCPVNLECQVLHILDVGSHALVIGRIEETYVSEECLTDGKPDVDKIKPFAWVTSPARRYQTLGEVVAKSHSIGLELSKEKTG
ncbi:MAG: flavin reductase family protein [Dehalococcoidales bacterium]|nr:flavin reductase family protein [Dehalococcoidales bacterium]